MTSRRNFILSGSAASAALLLADPLKAAGKYLPRIGGSQFGTLSLVDLGQFHHDQIRANADVQHRVCLDVIHQLRAEVPGSLILLNGNNIDLRSGNKSDHIGLLQQFSRAGVAAFVPGNTELAGGEDYLQDILHASGISSLWQKENSSLPTKIINSGHLRIGMIGSMGTGSTLNLKAINDAAASLKTSGCDLIIAFAPPSPKLRSIKSMITFAKKLSGTDLLLCNRPANYLHKCIALKNNQDKEIVISLPSQAGERLQSVDYRFNFLGAMRHVQVSNIG